MKDLLKRVHLSINEKKTEVFNLERSNHVRVTGVSITIDENGYRHISVGKKLKNEIFWSAINQFDKKDKSEMEIAHIKGLFSFVMSIEKNGIEDCYSENMKELIKARGYNSLKELVQALGNEL